MHHDASFLVSLTIALLLAGGIAQADGGDGMEDVIENVKNNERLYDDIEIILKTSYELGNPKYTIDQFVKSSNGENRTVKQGGLYYHKELKQSEFVSAKTNRSDYVAAYDGSNTKIVDNKAVANIHDGKFQCDRLIRPHCLLLRRGFVDFDLSSFLGGTAAVRQLGENAYSNTLLDWSIIGLDQVGSLRALKLECKSRNEGRPNDPGAKRLLWLALDRNYIPIKLEGYELSKSTTLPIEVGTIDDFTELKPGVWFPSKASLTIYDQASVGDNLHVVSNVEHYETIKAVLDPSYPKEMFSGVQIPDGAVVYRVKAGTITDSYVQGAPRQATSPPNKSYITHMIVMNLLAIPVIFFFLFRRRKVAVIGAIPK